LQELQKDLDKYMKPFLVKRCVTKRLDGCWDWSVQVWLSDRFFPDFNICSPVDGQHGKFLTEIEAIANMRFIVNQLKLQNKNEKTSK